MNSRNNPVPLQCWDKQAWYTQCYPLLLYIYSAMFFMANVPGVLWFKILSYTFVWRTLWSQISQPFIVANGGSPALSSRLKLFYSHLTDKGRENMAAVFQTTFSNAFSWTKTYKFRLSFHWSLFPRAQLTIFHHWFRSWFGAGQATSHYLNL